ncbi:nucleosome assembly protein [Xylariaceae sp. FL1272]|nr:nucleosome assembly protein [Xylariaceae sp. FL1272]
MAEVVDEGPVKEDNVFYAELDDLNDEADDIEIETIRHQHALSKPHFEKREKVIAKIPSFWPLVFEQAPSDIDQYIQPSDSVVLLSALESVSVSHFEIDNGGKGHPRSVSITLKFGDNDYFEDKVLEKKFWFRRGTDKSEGLVSEPVPIKWKDGKDLTQGLLDLVVKVWEQDKKKTSGERKKTKSKDWTPEQHALKDKINSFGLGGVSFFCWFGYRGLDISPEENEIAVAEREKMRADRAAGKPLKEDENGEEEEDDDDDDEDHYALEIFPDGDDLATAFDQDLYPDAIKYFMQAQGVDNISDADFEEMDEDDMVEAEDDDDDGDEAPPLKKVKA